MKTLILLIAQIAGFALGAEPFVFPLVGALKVEKATYFLNGDVTGGSVSVVLRDSKGVRSFVHFLTKDAGEEFGGGLLTFRSSKGGDGTTFARASEDEAKLLGFLKAACLSSFGSSDHEFLKDPSNWPGKKDGYDRMAMAALLRHFPTKAEQNGAEQPATAPDSKPEGDKKPQPESEGRSQ
jgi:hypothetical protein